VDNQATPPIQDSTELRKQIIEACLFLTRQGFCVGTWGNVSCRVEEGLLITPSRVNYDDLTPRDLIIVNLEGKKVSGTRLPSSEMHLHRMLMLRRPDFGAIVHTHSPYASIVAAAREAIPVLSDDTAQIIGDVVKCTTYIPGGRHKKLAEEACKTIGNRATAVLLANHGPVVGGRTLQEALVACQVLEKAAMMYVLGLNLKCRPIPCEFVEEERHRYLYKYGKENDAE